MAQVEIVLPQWGMGMQEGEMVEWLVDEGAEVAAGDELVEVDAAKTTEVVTAPAAGVLRAIRVPAGEVAQVGEVLAVLEVAD